MSPDEEGKLTQEEQDIIAADLASKFKKDDPSKIEVPKGNSDDTAESQKAEEKKQRFLKLQKDVLNIGNFFLTNLIKDKDAELPESDDPSVIAKLFGDSFKNRDQLRDMKNLYEDIIYSKYFNAKNPNENEEIIEKRASAAVSFIYDVQRAAENQLDGGEKPVAADNGTEKQPMVSEEKVDPTKRTAQEVARDLRLNRNKERSLKNKLKEAEAAGDQAIIDKCNEKMQTILSDREKLRVEKADIEAHPGVKPVEAAVESEINPEETPDSDPFAEEKAHTLLDDDLEKIESKEKNWSEKSYQWLQKNSKLRMATGVVTSVLGAYFGGSAGIYAAKGVTGAISGGIGFSGLNSFLKERAAVKNFRKYSDTEGNLDMSKIAEVLKSSGFTEGKDTKRNIDDETREELLDLYSEFTEISSAKGLKVMEKLDDKSEKSKNILQEKFPRLFDNKAVNWYRDQKWYTKALIGVGVGLGAGAAGGAAFGGAMVAKVACSGIAQLGMMSFQDADDRSGKSERYANSDKVLQLKEALEKIGLSQDDMDYIAKHREDIKKQSIKVGVVGAATVGILMSGISYATSQHEGAQHVGNGAPKANTETAPSAEDTPKVTIREVTPRTPDQQPVGIGKPTVSGTSELPTGGGATKEAQAAIEKNAFGAKVSNLDSHSNTLTAEKALAGGTLKGQDGDKMMHKIFEGLAGKDGLPKGAVNEAEVTRQMTEKAHEMGIIDSSGHLTDKIDAGKFDPQAFTKAVVEHDKGYFAGLNHDLNAYEQSHITAHHATEAATVEAGNNMERTGVANTATESVKVPQTESAAREALTHASGVRVPPTWHIGHNMDAYNGGKAITNAADMLKDKQIGKDSLNYLNTLYKSGLVKPEDVHVSANGQQLLVNSPDSISPNTIWSTDLKEKSIFSSLFPGRTIDATSVIPERTGITDAAQAASVQAEANKPSFEARTTVDPDGAKHQFYQTEDAPAQIPTNHATLPESHSNVAQQPVSPVEPIEPLVPKANVAPAIETVVPKVEALPFNSSLIDQIDKAQNYSFKINGEQLSVSGERLSQIVSEAKKYFADNHATFKNALQEKDSINLYVSDYVKNNK